MSKYKCVGCKKTRYFKKIGNCALKHCAKYHPDIIHFKKITKGENQGLKKWE